jgi:hypothetical protein
MNQLVIKWINSNSKNKSFLFIACAETFLVLLCVFGDYYVFQSLSLINLFLIKSVSILNETLVRALLDNIIHGLIGFVSWSIITYPNLNYFELVVCWLLASIIDVDHFLSAKSLRLIDAISLQKRPFLHNSLTLLILNLMLFIILACLSPNKKYKWSMIFFCSWFTHHIRDSTRRGMWFGSFGSFGIRYNVYLMATIGMPLIFRCFYFNKFKLSVMP